MGAEHDIKDAINQFDKDFPEIKNEKGNNVIYYDPNYDKRPWEIFEDAEIFKNKVNGAFILVMDIQSLTILLEEIIKLETECKFDLICTGGACKVVFSLIKNNNYEYLFKRGCLFTYNPDKYKNMIDLYPLIKGIYIKNEEVLKFLEENERSTIILRTLKLITLQDYIDKYKTIHKMIARY